MTSGAAAATASAPTLVRVHELRIEAGPRVLVEQGSFELRAGETWCLLGPNGSGKSTLLHVLAGLRRPQAGSMQLAGSDQHALDPRAAARIRGLLLQHQTDSFGATVEETVLLGRHPHIGTFDVARAHDRACVDAAMRSMDVADLAGRDVRTLSGGERQRVALATLLAQDPTLFLLDEPSAHLDLAHQVSLFRTLAGLTQAGRGVLFATHDYNLALRFATHALLIAGNGALHAGPACELLQAPRLSAIFGFPLVYLSERAAGAFAPQW